MLAEEKLKLSLHFTFSGFSKDSIYVKDIEVSREITLNELKEIVCDSVGATCDMDCLRLREKNPFFGRIFREGLKTLKSLQIKDRSAIVYQILNYHEVLDLNTYVLLLS